METPEAQGRMRVAQIAIENGRTFVTVVHLPGGRDLRVSDGVRRIADGARWTVNLEDGPVAYSEGGVVIGSLLYLRFEGREAPRVGDELLLE